MKALLPARPSCTAKRAASTRSPAKPRNGHTVEEYPADWERLEEAAPTSCANLQMLDQRPEAS